MSKPFMDCVRNGGKVKTIESKDKDTYIHICFLNGNAYKGEVMKKKNHGKGVNKFAGALSEK